ncbi:MAG: cytochrome c [bacterium]|nr:cytochrome c [bacterium]
MRFRVILFALVLTLPLVYAEDNAGKAVFEANCQMCHSADSNEALIGPGLAGLKSGKMPKSGEEATEKSLMKLIEEGRPDSNPKMPPFEGLLGKKEKKALVAYLLTL